VRALVRIIHVVPSPLDRFRGQIAEPGLERLGANGENQDEYQGFHDFKIDQNSCKFQCFDPIGFRWLQSSRDFLC
jgi:hypothetical protein